MKMESIFLNIRKKMHSDLFITFTIDSYKNYLIQNHVFQDLDTIHWFFLNGGCYTFSKILKKLCNDGTYMINNDYSHCALKIGKNIYHILGKVDDFKDFKKANQNDTLYMNNNFSQYNIYNNNVLWQNFEEDFIYQTVQGFLMNKPINIKLSNLHKV